MLIVCLVMRKIMKILMMNNYGDVKFFIFINLKKNELLYSKKIFNKILYFYNY